MDTSGKTDTHRINVIVNSEGGNLAPLAVINYSVDGNKYKFWPVSYDPNGFILKYKYTILKLRNDESGIYDPFDSYSCCDSCDPPPPDSPDPPDPFYDLCFFSY